MQTWPMPRLPPGAGQVLPVGASRKAAGLVPEKLGSLAALRELTMLPVPCTVRDSGSSVVSRLPTWARLFNVHMKDLAAANDKASQVAVGEGLMPARGIFEALAAMKYKGFVDLEYEIHGDDPMPGVSESFAYMRGVLAGMGYSKRG